MTGARTCFKSSYSMAWFANFVGNGDLGVDMFFVLSGFLIAFILLKEHKKYDGIDVFNFYRGRCLRIWPALALCCLFIFFSNTAKDGINRGVIMTSTTPLMFINNMVDARSHLWSVAVEFQFYIISPFIVMYMARYDNPMKPAVVLAIISTILNFILNWYSCSTSAPSGDFSGCGWENWDVVYEKTYTRMSPYVFGMYAAFVHLQDKNHSLINKPSTPYLEWLCTVVLFYIVFFGYMWNDRNDLGPAKYVYMSTYR